jgi:hypothetical protein
MERFGNGEIGEVKAVIAYVIAYLDCMFVLEFLKALAERSESVEGSLVPKKFVIRVRNPPQLLASASPGIQAQ